MIVTNHVQEFTNNDTGEIDGVTFQALELWTADGLEIIPAGVRFQYQKLPKVIKKLVKDNEIPLLILREYHLIKNNKPISTIERGFRANLIKHIANKKTALKPPKTWYFVNRLRIEFICIVLRLVNVCSRLLKYP